MPRLGRSRPASNYWHQRIPPVLPQTFQGTASLPASTALTAGGTFQLQGSALLAAVTSLTAAAVSTQQGAATMTAVTTVTAAGHQTIPVAATMTAVTTVTAGSTSTQQAAATMTAVTTIGAVSGAFYSSQLAVITGLVALPTTGLETLICSITSNSGTDQFGNPYPAGLAVGIVGGNQVRADLNGNLIVGGNLTVNGVFSDAQFAALQAQVSSIAAQVLLGQYAYDALIGMITAATDPDAVMGNISTIGGAPTLAELTTDVNSLIGNCNTILGQVNNLKSYFNALAVRWNDLAGSV